MRVFTIDIGNTRAKLILFHSGTVVEEVAVVDFSPEIFKMYCEQWTWDKMAIVTVSAMPEFLENYRANNPRVYCLDTASHNILAIKPSLRLTLGCDRLAACLGALSFTKSQTFMVIVLGTCVTYQLVVNHEIIGGGIAPGLALRLKSLHEHTYALPLVTPHYMDSFLVDNTSEAINAATVKGLVYEIQGFIDEYRTQYPDLPCFITGGDAPFVGQYLDKVEYVAHLVSEGLVQCVIYKA